MTDNIFAPDHWDVLATLFTGLAAVLGAVHIGRKQVELLGQERREALFDRRYQVLAATHNMARAIMTLPSGPSAIDDDAYRSQLLIAPLVFGRTTVANLDRLDRRFTALVNAMRDERASVLPERGGPSREAVARVQELRRDMGDWSERVMGVFLPEMALSPSPVGYVDRVRTWVRAALRRPARD